MINFYFAKDLENLSPKAYTSPAIVFSPSQDEWNNFTYRTQFDYAFLDMRNEVVVRGQVHLAFQDFEADPWEKVRKILKDLPLGRVAAKKLPPFYTLQLGMEAYRNFMEVFSEDEAEGILVEMNDLVAMKRLPKQPSWVKKATESRLFQRSFIRFSEAFYAYHNAGPILDGLDQERFGGISHELTLNFKLPVFSNAHSLEFSFSLEDDLPKRIAVIIGKNGVGKSQSLVQLTQSLLKGDGRLTTKAGDKPQINRLIVCCGSAEICRNFPKRSKSGRIFYQLIDLSRGRGGKGQAGLGDIMVRLARSEHSIKGRSRWELFCDALKAITPLEEVVVLNRRPRIRETKVPRADCISVAEFLEGAELQTLNRWAGIDPESGLYRAVDDYAYPLSSGQKTFLYFAAHACLHIENGSLVLLDEPETHLHPNLIGDFVKVLDQLLFGTGSLAIVSTHSVYFVREVPRSQVTVLRTGENCTVETVPVRLKTFGADIGAISSFVFEELGSGEMMGQLARRLKEADGLRRLKAIENELPSEAIMHLREAVGKGIAS